MTLADFEVFTRILAELSLIAALGIGWGWWRRT